MYPQSTRTDIHNEKFRNRSKYQTDIFLLFYNNELSNTKYKDRTVYNLYSTNPLPYLI